MGPGPAKKKLSDLIENINRLNISLTNYKGAKWVREKKKRNIERSKAKKVYNLP